LKEEKFRKSLYKTMNHPRFRLGDCNTLESLITYTNKDLLNYFINELKKNPKNIIHIEMQRIILFQLLIHTDQFKPHLQNKVKKNCKFFFKKLFSEENPSEAFEDFHTIQKIIKESNLEADLN